MRLFGKNYINRQRKDGVCVAISIINALKWSGSSKANLKHVKYIHKKIHGSTEETKERSVREVMNKCHKYFNFSYKLYPTLKEIKKHLSSEDNSIILSYFCNKENGSEIGHAILVFVKNGKIYSINERKKNITFTWKEFKERYMNKTDWYPSIYKLTKNEAK